MVNKFLANKNGGGIGSVNYLLDKKRVQNGTARVLKGEEHITRALINSIDKKQKTTFAVMSFEEQNITESVKMELIAEWEKTFLTGLKPDQYNTLWVEHTDKGRLELNVLVPKIELTTGRALNPYFNKSDFHLADLFQKKMNLKYGFSDPQDPAKAQSVRGGRKEIGLFKDYQELDTKLKELVAQGHINSRDEMVALLKQSGIEVTREKAENSISVKLPDSKKARKFVGGIYEKQFTDNQGLSAIGAERERAERAYTAGKSRRAGELEAVSERLDSAIEKRAIFNQGRFSKPKRNLRQVAKASRDAVSKSITLQPTVAVRAVDKRNERVEKNDSTRKAIDEYAQSRAERTRERDNRIEQRERRHHRVVDLNLNATSIDIGDAGDLEQRATERRAEIARENARRDAERTAEVLSIGVERIASSIIAQSLADGVRQLFERVHSAIKQIDEKLVQAVKIRNQIARFANGKKPVVADKGYDLGR